MNLKKLRQILKALADDTRLRIVSLLYRQELTVKRICNTLKVSQSTISKHLVRLRLLKIVIDRRQGNFIYYKLNRDSDQGKIVGFLISQFGGGEIFSNDAKYLKRTANKP